MDPETIRLLASGFFTLAGSLVTLAASLGIARFTTRAQTTNAREQRLFEERKWQHEHAGEIYASVHRGLLSLKVHIHGVMYTQMSLSEADVKEGNRLREILDSELSRLMFVAGSDVTEPAIKATVSCRNLYDAARGRIRERLPEYEALWHAANNDYVKALEEYKNAAARTLRIGAND